MNTYISASPATVPSAFNRLAWSNLAAQSAEQLSLAAVPLVAVLLLEAGPGEIGTLAAIQTLPYLLLAIPLGVIADRVARRELMMWCEVARALSLLGLLAMVLTGQLSLMGLGILGFIGAVGTVGYSVAAPALVPGLVPREMLARANGRLELARSMAFAGGPAIAGALVAWAGASAAFVVAAVLSIAAVMLLLRLNEPSRPASASRHPLLEIRDGARFVLRHEFLKPILVTGIAWNISWFVLQAAYVPYAVRALGLSAQAVGITLGCYGAGMVVGALLAPRIVGAMSFGRAIQLGPLVSVLAISAIAATLLVPSGWLAAAGFFLFGVGPIIWTITTTTLRQNITPGAMMGRVSSVFLTANAGARPLGALLGGVVGSTWGEPACLLLAAAGFVFQAVLIIASRLRELEVIPAAA